MLKFKRKKMSTETVKPTADFTDSNTEAVNATSETSPENATQVQADANEALKQALAEAETMKDKYLRLNAEFDNYKRRTLRERMDLLKTANAEVMIALLPVLDDFDRALKALSIKNDQTVLEGITLIHNKFKSLLEQKGLKAMDCQGKPFDVDLHDAITQVPSTDELQRNTIMEVVEKGYFLEDKVIRHAKVVVYQ
jgi:molecular chaperone GrpE